MFEIWSSKSKPSWAGCSQWFIHPLWATSHQDVWRRLIQSQVARECEVGTCVRQTPHPCIVRLFMIFFDETSGLYTLVMEFCPSNLFQQILLAKEQAFTRLTSGSVYLPPPQTLDWLGQIFLGLEHMHHRLNILFRDLKPDNVVIDQSLCAKLADFGSGRFGASSGTFSFGHPAGTVGYCAPEVLYGQPHDECADLYSLGVVTWLLFTGGMHNTAPPVSQRPEFSAHFHDWAQLHHCIQINFPPFRGPTHFPFVCFVGPKIPKDCQCVQVQGFFLCLFHWFVDIVTICKSSVCDFERVTLEQWSHVASKDYPRGKRLFDSWMPPHWVACQGMQGVDDPIGQAQLAGQFTWSLLQQPTGRMKHQDIRRHPLLAPLQLPGFVDGPEQVELWLQRRIAKSAGRLDRIDTRASVLSSSSTSDISVTWEWKKLATLLLTLQLWNPVWRQYILCFLFSTEVANHHVLWIDLRSRVVSFGAVGKTSERSSLGQAYSRGVADESPLSPGAKKMINHDKSCSFRCFVRISIIFLRLRFV